MKGQAVLAANAMMLKDMIIAVLIALSAIIALMWFLKVNFGGF